MSLDGMFGGTFALTVLIGLCVGIPFLAVAVWLFISARRSNQQAQASQTWPSVLGTVQASSVEARRSTDSDGHTSTSYYPTVMYEYEVLGHAYRGERITFGMAVGSGSHATAQAIVDRYVPGNKIRIYYNPNNPGEAVLERVSGSSNILIWVAIFIVAIICITTIVPLIFLGGFFAFLSDFLKFIP